MVKFRVNSGKRVGGSKVNLFVITGHSSESVAFARWQQGLGFVVPRTTACIGTEIENHLLILMFTYL